MRVTSAGPAMRTVPGISGARWRGPPGRVAREKRGSNGFGYDPVFVPDGLTVTSAELSPEEKDARSHRGQAFAALVPVVAEMLGRG